jgi:hypothetical protein
MFDKGSGEIKPFNGEELVPRRDGVPLCKLPFAPFTAIIDRLDSWKKEFGPLARNIICFQVSSIGSATCLHCTFIFAPRRHGTLQRPINPDGAFRYHVSDQLQVLLFRQTTNSIQQSSNRPASKKTQRPDLTNRRFRQKVFGCRCAFVDGVLHAGTPQGSKDICCCPTCVSSLHIYQHHLLYHDATPRVPFVKGQSAIRKNG